MLPALLLSEPNLRYATMRMYTQTVPGQEEDGMNTVLARRVLRLLPQPGGELPAGVTCGRLARLVEEILGDTIERYPDGRMLIWSIARHDGYNIPEYPMAGCGDVREFLEDEGVRNVPDWYERHLGISREDYDAIWKYELVMVRNQAFWRRVFQVPTAVSQQASSLGGAYLEELRSWLTFALGNESVSDDPRLFKR